ncbi:zinc metalloproteinase nas-13-like isoform X4 [Littorina saxatilis]|uniref:zinc metalloproteinase nas-13-like isoform X4 n=1 Tax=Littorina saxatilis TaxID=31220 RepID=UPI0038B562AA
MSMESQTVPYEIDTRAFNEREQRVLQSAMNDWMKYTCLNFRPATSSDRHKIKFVDGDGCASYVGMQSGSKQDVLLASGCRHKGTVIHELGHALGLHHEQTRPDRDQYVKINYDNIPDHLEYNFKKYSWSVIANVDVPYDYTSIMHYGKTYFAEDKSKPTIETVDKSAKDVIGNRVGLSFRDIKTINKVYECQPQNCNLQDSYCKGEGFVGMDCECWCPADVSKDSDPYVQCDRIAGTGNQGTNWGGNTGGNTGGGGPINKPAACEDQNSKCTAWSRAGHCSTSKTYMSSFCKKSCNLCGTNNEQCQDLHNMCSYWTQSGHCSDGYAAFMGLTCKRSCGLCGGGLGQIFDAGATVCRDENEHCSYWSRVGHCGHPEYMEYMSMSCKRSCNLCPQIQGGNNGAFSDWYGK